jgi:hypothetical protein
MSRDELRAALAAMPISERMASLAGSILEMEGPGALQQVAGLISSAQIMAQQMSAADRLLLATEMICAARALNPQIGIDAAVWN